jgi:hypothetical protein
MGGYPETIAVYWPLDLVERGAFTASGFISGAAQPA